MSKLITFIGAPCSGKSTLANSVQSEIKIRGGNSIFINEVATDYIAEYGIPNTPQDQMVVFYKQLNREMMYKESKEYIVCDSSSMLNYFYFRTLFPKKPENKDIAIINHIQKEILKSINNWDYIFYVTPIETDSEDGIRYHDKEEIQKIDRWIKSYLELENIEFIDMSNIALDDRLDFVLNTVCDKKLLKKKINIDA